MIPVRMEVSGFLSYLDTVVVDFTPFDLACISGSNGAGKSSLLDAMTWALFGEARKRDDSLLNARSQDGARVVFDFDYEGLEYRIVRAKAPGKTALLDFFSRRPDGAWHTLSEHAMRATQERIQNTIRLDYETFTNASFFLQGRADQFTQQNASKRKQILSSILGLDIWEVYLETARKRRRSVEGEVARLDGMIHSIDEELKEEPQRVAALERLQKALVSVQSRRKAQEKNRESIQKIVAVYEDQLSLVQTQENRVKEALERVRMQQEELVRSQMEAAGYRQELGQAQQIEQDHQRWQEVRANLEEIGKVAQRFHELEMKRAVPLAEIAAEAARLEQQLRNLEEQAQRIESAAGALKQYHDELTGIDALLAETRREVDLKPELETSQRSATNHMAELKAENNRLKAEMDQIKQRITRLEESSGSLCPLCGQPLTAQDRQRLIAELMEEGKAKGDQHRTNQSMLTEHQIEIQAIAAHLEAVRAAEVKAQQQTRQKDQVSHKIEISRLEIETWEGDGKKQQAALQEQLRSQAYAQPARERLVAVDDQLRTMGYDPQAHEMLKKEEQELRGSEDRIRALERSQAALAPLERQIAKMQDESVSLEKTAGKEQENLAKFESRLKEMLETLPDLQAAEQELLATREEESQCNRELGAARGLVEVLEPQKLRREKLTGERAALQKKISQLKKLEKAFGKDGIPALLIEQALPQIESQANEILDRLTNGSMSVRFVTQRDYKDKNREDKKETLDIQISDASGTREYELFSGGEAFRINFALRLALSRVLSQRAGARLQTLVIDEGFGSQDMEGRQRLIEAITQVQGEFQKILVITHLDELKDQFPARIEVEKTPRGSKVNVVV
ncbi:MAG: SMC family ATPase [Anaerolineae bacterium]|nr:SMC family ATPase [Anaerolineae bacterium]